MVGAVAYHHSLFGDINERRDGVISTRHTGTGLSLTIGGLTERLENGVRTESFVVKGGWLMKLISQGNTAFSADFSKGKDMLLLF